jgi:hypothetical protein
MGFQYSLKADFLKIFIQIGLHSLLILIVAGLLQQSKFLIFGGNLGFKNSEGTFQRIFKI